MYLYTHDYVHMTYYINLKIVWSNEDLGSSDTAGSTLSVFGLQAL